MAWSPLWLEGSKLSQDKAWNVLYIQQLISTLFVVSLLFFASLQIQFGHIPKRSGPSPVLGPPWHVIQLVLTLRDFGLVDKSNGVFIQIPFWVSWRPFVTFTFVKRILFLLIIRHWFNRFKNISFPLIFWFSGLAHNQRRTNSQSQVTIKLGEGGRSGVLKERWQGRRGLGERWEGAVRELSLQSIE